MSNKFDAGRGTTPPSPPEEIVEGPKWKFKCSIWYGFTFPHCWPITQADISSLFIYNGIGFFLFTSFLMVDISKTPTVIHEKKAMFLSGGTLDVLDI